MKYPILLALTSIFSLQAMNSPREDAFGEKKIPIQVKINKAILRITIFENNYNSALIQYNNTQNSSDFNATVQALYQKGKYILFFMKDNPELKKNNKLLIWLQNVYVTTHLHMTEFCLENSNSEFKNLKKIKRIFKKIKTDLKLWPNKQLNPQTLSFYHAVYTQYQKLHTAQIEKNTLIQNPQLQYNNNQDNNNIQNRMNLSFILNEESEGIEKK